MSRYLVLYFCVAAGIAVATSGPAEGALFSGSVSGYTNPGGPAGAQTGNVVTRGGAWDDGPVTLSWDIDWTGSTWSYKYTFDRPSDGNISHIIIELSANVARGEISNVKINNTAIADSTDNYDVATYTAGGSNPNLPGPVYGLKINRPDSIATDPIVFSFDINRAPVWGDFYAKNGNAGKDGAPTGFETNEAWNLGFVAADPLGAPANGSLSDHILRPDTIGGPVGSSLVPEPTSIAAWIGLACCGAVRMRRRWRKGRATV